MKNTLRFEELSLSQEILKAIAEMGFTEMSPIQAQAIPYIIEGRDVIGLAMTGTGKTAAFSLPLIDKIDQTKKGVQALIVCPTRELAIQVANEIQKFLKYKKFIHVLPVYGGQSIEGQLRILKQGVQIVVGTPGRLLDHMDRGSIKLGHVTAVVLDEADEMMDMGFRGDIEKILQKTPETRQTVTFSATMPSSILELVKKYQKNPQMVQVSMKNSAATTVEQHYFEVPSHNRFPLLETLMKKHNPYQSIVFCNTKHKVDDVTLRLRRLGYLADALHSDISQPKRNKIMNRFRAGDLQILVATDVAARGIDVPNIDIIFNFEIPKDEKSYVHRIGRTGRAGKTGMALSFVSERDGFAFRNIKRTIQTNLVRQQLPALEHCAQELNTASAQPESSENLLAMKIQRALTRRDIEAHLKTIESMVSDEQTPIKIAAALLSLVSENQSSSFSSTPRTPRSSKSFDGGFRRQRRSFDRSKN